MYFGGACLPDFLTLIVTGNRFFCQRYVWKTMCGDESTRQQSAGQTAPDDAPLARWRRLVVMKSPVQPQPQRLAGHTLPSVVVAMGLLEALTPRGARPKPQLSLALPLEQLQACDSAHEAAATPRSSAQRLTSKLRQMLTPRGRRRQPGPAADSPAGCSPGSGPLIAAYRPTLTAMMEARTYARTGSSGGSGRRALTTTPSRGPVLPAAASDTSDASSDTASEADSNSSDASSLDGKQLPF